MIWFPLETTRSGIVGSYGSSNFNFFEENSHTVFHSYCMDLHSHKQCTRVCLSLHPSVQFSSVSVVSDSLHPHELQHAGPPCPSLSPGVHSNLPTLVLGCLSDRCKVISHCDFDLYFPDYLVLLASLHVPVSYLDIFFGKLFGSLAHFKNQIVLLL